MADRGEGVKSGKRAAEGERDGRAAGSPAEAVLLLLEGCPAVTGGLGLELESVGEKGLGLFTERGADTLTRYVSGTCLKQFPFSLRCRRAAVSGRERLEAQRVLAGMAAYLCGKEVLAGGESWRLPAYPQLDNRYGPGRIQIISMEQMTAVFLSGRQEDGTDEYRVLLNLKYEEKGK